jgi:tetratricopeptide (TPR) repeat protein
MGKTKNAIALFKRALEQKASHTALVAFELAKLIGREGMISESIEYFTISLKLIEKDIIESTGLEMSLAIRKRSEILMHRSCAYEALGLKEIQARDIIEIARSDETFRIRYIEEGKRLLKEGFPVKAEKIRKFITKMDKLMAINQMQMQII